MSIKEKFRKRIKHRCPDCDNDRMSIVDIIDDETGASYVETFRICEECGYREDITDKRNNNKVEVVEVVVPTKSWDRDKSNKYNRR
jgi:transcriptional regulator NrdR family protein